MFKKLPPLALIVLLLPSCIQTVLKDHNFTKGNPVEINGAQVVSSVKPMGGKGGFSISAMVFAAATGSLDGPFLWRVEAEGVEGEQEWIRVNEARVTTEKQNAANLFQKNSSVKKLPLSPSHKKKARASRNSKSLENSPFSHAPTEKSKSTSTSASTLKAAPKPNGSSSKWTLNQSGPRTPSSSPPKSSKISKEIHESGTGNILILNIN